MKTMHHITIRTRWNMVYDSETGQFTAGKGDEQMDVVIDHDGPAARMILQVLAAFLKLASVYGMLRECPRESNLPHDPATT